LIDGDLLDAVPAIELSAPTETAPDRRRRFQVIEGGFNRRSLLMER
jgi:hypothetical protein